MNFTNNCNTNKNETRQCKCDYLLISEPPYDPNVFGTPICGQKNMYISRTRSVSIKYLYKNRHSNVLKLNYITQSKLLEAIVRYRNISRPIRHIFLISRIISNDILHGSYKVKIHQVAIKSFQFYILTLYVEGIAIW